MDTRATECTAQNNRIRYYLEKYISQTDPTRNHTRNPVTHCANRWPQKKIFCCSCWYYIVLSIFDYLYFLHIYYLHYDIRDFVVIFKYRFDDVLLPYIYTFLFVYKCMISSNNIPKRVFYSNVEMLQQKSRSKIHKERAKVSLRPLVNQHSGCVRQINGRRQTQGWLLICALPLYPAPPIASQLLGRYTVKHTSTQIYEPIWSIPIPSH